MNSASSSWTILLGLDGGEDIGAHRLLLHAVAEVLGHLVGHVGVEKGPADLLEGLGHIYFSDLSFAFEYLEGSFQSVGEVFEHTIIF